MISLKSGPNIKALLVLYKPYTYRTANKHFHFIFPQKIASTTTPSKFYLTLELYLNMIITKSLTPI